MKLWLLVMTAGWLACGKGTDAGSPSAAAGRGGEPGSAVAVAVAVPDRDAGVVLDAAAAPSGVTPKIAAARCDDPCLFLLDTSIDTLAAAYHATCAGGKASVELDDCKQLDYVRNCIYAAHGVVYKKRKWKKLFAGKPWYEPRPGVVAKTIAMSEVEHANVHELYMRGKACKKGMSITGADYERLAAWFAKLPKPAMPKLVFRTETNEVGGDPEAIAGPAFLKWLTALDATLAKQFARGKEVEVSDDGAALTDQDPLLALMHITDPASLRAITVRVELAHGTEEAPGSEDLTLRFFYGTDDQLVAIAGDHSSVWD